MARGCAYYPAPSSPVGEGASPFCPGCPARGMNTGDPVSYEAHADDKYVLLGEAPGVHETIEGRPFVGPSGIELQRALNAVGVERSACHITNVISCRPPKNDLEALNISITRKNKKLGKKARDEGKKFRPILKPVEACRSRLYSELSHLRTRNIVCLGKSAAKSLRGGDVAIMDIRGGCEERPAPWDARVKLKVAYTMHPSFVLRQPAYREVFRHDLRKAFRFFEGRLDWNEPKISISAAPADVRKYLSLFAQVGKAVAYDLETDGIDTRTCNVRCISLSNEDHAIVIPFLGINGESLIGQREYVEVKQLLREFLFNPPVPLIGHNAGQFDRLVCEQWLGTTPTLAADTLIVHLLADNELPHNLGFVGSFYTDNPEAWKADHTATEAKSDRDLHLYCGKDACVTARIARPLAQDVRKRSQQHLLGREHLLQQLGTLMQRTGMEVDQERVLEHHVLLDQRARELLEKCRENISPTFNPQSTRQLGALLFDDWKLPPHHYSEKTGDPSTDDATLRSMITQYGLDEEKIRFLRTVRAYRKTSKLLGTYIKPLFLSKVSRSHPSYNRLPVTGRYSSSNPNLQNVPYSLRDIYIAKPGHVLIGADMDQLEMRLIAEEADAKHSLHVVNSGLDPHNETMEIVYGKGIWKLDGAPEERALKGGGTFKATRDITKNVRYAWQYAASTKRIHEQIVSVEDDGGNLLYAHMQIEDVRQVVEGLKRADPEIPKWWRRIENTYRKEGFIGDTLWGRRRYFKNEDKINELVNFPIQSGGVHIVHEAMIELVCGPQPWFATHPVEEPGGVMPIEWLINHGHDALYLEVPEEEAEEAAALLQRVMTRRRNNNAKLTYTANAAIGSRWNEV